MAIHNNKYDIQLDHPILRDHGVLYLKALAHTFIFELTLAQASDVIEYSSNTPEANYKITNLELQYGCIHNEYLAQEAAASYQVGTGFFLWKQHFATKRLPFLESQWLVYSSVLVTEPYNAGARNSEKFVNPNITSVDISIDGMPN